MVLKNAKAKWKLVGSLVGGFLEFPFLGLVGDSHAGLKIFRPDFNA